MKSKLTMALVAILFCISARSPAFAADDISGTWVGVLSFPNFPSLRFVLHVQGTGSAMTATADSPDQGQSNIPVDIITQSGTTVKFAMMNLGVIFSGAVSGDTISGTFTQRGVGVPLSMSRTS